MEDNPSVSIYESASHMFAAAAQLSRLEMFDEAEHLVDHAVILVMEFRDPDDDFEDEQEAAHEKVH